MGFELYGRAPRSDAGRQFWANAGGWGDLARVCLRVAPGPCSQMSRDGWFYKGDGDQGLDDAGAVALADALDQAINTDALRYEDALSGQENVKHRDLLLRSRLPDGRQLADVAPDMIPSGKPWLIKRLRELSAFLRACGGFKIW